MEDKPQLNIALRVILPVMFVATLVMAGVSYATIEVIGLQSHTQSAQIDKDSALTGSSQLAREPAHNIPNTLAELAIFILLGNAILGCTLYLSLRQNILHPFNNLAEQLPADKAKPETPVNAATQHTYTLSATKKPETAADNGKSLSAADIGHELRTPLNAIIGFSKLLATEDDIPDRHKQNLTIIQRSGAQLLALINNIFDPSKVEWTKVGCQIAPQSHEGTEPHNDTTPPPDDAQYAEQDAAFSHDGSLNLEGVNVLIVDDVPDIRLFLRALLAKTGANVHEADNGESALEIIRIDKPKLLLLDWKMPGMSGLEVIDHLHQQTDFAAPAIIVLSANTVAEDRQKAIQAGAKAFLSKPIKSAILFDIIRKLGITHSANTSATEPHIQVECQLDPNELNDLPENCIIQIKQALIELNPERLKLAIASIRHISPSFADSLERHQAQLRYRELWQFFGLIDES